MQTDETGYFDIGGLPAGIHQIELRDPNGIYAVEVYEDALNFGEGIDLEVVAGGTTWVDPVLDRGGRIYGQVVDPDGSRIANVTVMFNGWRDNLDTPDDRTDGWWEWYTECYTDENGDFSMSGSRHARRSSSSRTASGGFVERVVRRRPHRQPSDAGGRARRRRLTTSAASSSPGRSHRRHGDRGRRRQRTREHRGHRRPVA